MAESPAGANVLPKELEMKIFEIAAYSQPKSITKLLLVARRVRVWLEPLLYRILSISLDATGFPSSDPPYDGSRMTLPDWFKILETKSPAFLRDSVRCVALLMLPEASVVSLLSSCSRISRLAIWHISPKPTFLHAIAALPLLRLSADLALFGPPGVDLGRPILNQLTHLDTFSQELCANTWLTLACLPCLTHLAITITLTNADPAAIPNIVANCTSIEVLVLLSHTAGLDQYDYFSDDPRTLIIVVGFRFLEEWERSAHGDEDFWVRAERFIEKRRSGEVHASQYTIRVDS
ncbi:hypothetical protein C8R47DRAFT_704193 [Mycena vitilis]|nr:hypothetical protein C8R47DRAFT_704193 [Mycena vitilis]